VNDGIETRRQALVVAYDRATSSAVGGWLEATGFEVALCPGPLGPSYRCVAAKASESGCPLIRDADVIVLDLWLQSDVDDRGSAALDLVHYYRSRGKRLLMLDHGMSTSSLFPAERVAVLPWPPVRAEVERFAVALAGEGGRSTDVPDDETFFGETRPPMA